MIDEHPIGQKQRINGKEITIAHIGNDIMVLSVFFPIRELDKSYKFRPDTKERNAYNVSKLLAPLFVSPGERGWVIAQLICNSHTTIFQPFEFVVCATKRMGLATFGGCPFFLTGVHGRRDSITKTLISLL